SAPCPRPCNPTRSVRPVSQTAARRPAAGAGHPDPPQCHARVLQSPYPRPRPLPEPAPPPPSDARCTQGPSLSCAVRHELPPHTQMPAQIARPAFPVSVPSRGPLHRTSHLQVGANERPQIAVQHPVHVPHLHLRTVIFHHPVGREHVRPDLRAEIDVQFGVLNFLALGALLLQLIFVELRSQNAHSTIAILVLRALVLAGNHDSRWIVRDANRRVRRVDVLSALAPRAISIHTQVLRLDHHLDALVNLRRDINAGKRRVPPLGLV